MNNFLAWAIPVGFLVVVVLAAIYIGSRLRTHFCLRSKWPVTICISMAGSLVSIIAK